MIVKTDLNYSGIPEMLAVQKFQRDGKPADLLPGPVVSTDRPYPILQSAREVPDGVWNNPGLVVERFLPEQDMNGFWLRVWVFFRRSRALHAVLQQPADREEVPASSRANRRQCRKNCVPSANGSGLTAANSISSSAAEEHSCSTRIARLPRRRRRRVLRLTSSNAHLAGGLDELLRK